MTSSFDYRYKTSSWGWSAKSKKAEMREPATRFLVVTDEKRQSIVGLLSWQVDVEEDEAIIYWYASSGNRIDIVMSYKYILLGTVVELVDNS